MSIWKHIKAFLFLPFVVLVVIPSSILYLTGYDTYHLFISPLSLYLLIGGGITFILVGASFMAVTIRDMSRIGKGTLAPWDKKQNLVVAGLYRFVRNPMLTGVILILTGETLATASMPIFCWSITFTLINSFYIALVEEKALEAQFGDEYRIYKQNVPRWLPRLTPYEAEQIPESLSQQ